MHSESHRKTLNQQILDQSIAEFRRDYAYGPDLLTYLARAEVQIVRVERRPQSRWLVHLVLPTRLGEMFDVDLELLCMATEYDHVEPRLLEDLQQNLQTARVDDEIALLVSADPHADRMIRRRPGSTAVLTLDATTLKSSDEDLGSALARALVTVDHFNVTVPIRDPSAFFGRETEIQEALKCLAAGQHLGVFGLRKAGKSSFLNQVQRLLTDDGWVAVRLDLNAYGLRAWRAAEDLVRRVQGVARGLGIRTPGLRGVGTTATNVRALWLHDLEGLLDAIGDRIPSLVVIDEVDSVLPGRILAAGGEERDRRDLMAILAQLRSLAQQRQADGTPYPVVLSAGVDSHIYEAPNVGRADNPLYQFSRVKFLEPLDREALARMTRALGKRTGMRFRDHQLIDELQDEYGGHPLLTRQACSWVHHHRPDGAVPYNVELADLEAAFTATGTGTPLRHALDTLDEFAQWYPEEAELLPLFIKGEQIEATRLRHAMDYGLVDPRGGFAMRALSRP